MEIQAEERKSAREMVRALEEVKEEIKVMKREICTGLKEIAREMRDGLKKGDVGGDKAEYGERRGTEEAEGMTPSSDAFYANREKEKDKKKKEKDEGEVKEKRRSWAEEVEDKEAEECRAAGKQAEKDEDGDGDLKEEEKKRLWNQEMAERKKRRKNVIIKALDSEKGRGREGMEKWLKETTEREMKVEQVREIECRSGAKDRMTLVVLKEENDSQRLLEMSGKIWRLAKVAVERDQTFLERKRNWMVRSKAGEERRNGKEVEMGDGWIKSNEETWWWNEREEEWEKSSKEKVIKKVQGKEEGKKDAKEKEEKRQKKEEEKEKKKEEEIEKEKEKNGRERKEVRRKEIEVLRQRLKELVEKQEREEK